MYHVNTSMTAAIYIVWGNESYGTLPIPFGVPRVEKLNIVSVHITNVGIVCELHTFD